MVFLLSHRDRSREPSKKSARVAKVKGCDKQDPPTSRAHRLMTLIVPSRLLGATLEVILPFVVNSYLPLGIPEIGVQQLTFNRYTAAGDGFRQPSVQDE